MLKKFVFLPLFAVALMLSACEGAEGPQGIAGPQGEQGDQGPTGRDGNANVRAFTVEFDERDAELSQDRTMALYGIETNVITQDIVDSGVVLGFVRPERGVWSAMPFSIAYDPGGNNSVDYTLEFNYMYEPGAFAALIRTSSGTLSPIDLDVRFVVIEGAASKSGSYDFATYEEAAHALGLPLN